MSGSRVWRDGRPAGGYRPLVGYLALQAVLVGVSAILGRTPAGRFVGLLAGIVGFAVLIAGLVRRRPPPRAAWWLVAAGALAQLGIGVGLAVIYGLADIGHVTEPLPGVLGGLSLPSAGWMTCG